MIGCSLFWGKLKESKKILTPSTLLTSTSVYLVLGQDRAGQWYEITQTTATRTMVEGSMTAKLRELMVIGVQGDGLKTMTRILTDGINCEEVEDKVMQHKINGEIETIEEQ